MLLVRRRHSLSSSDERSVLSSSDYDEMTTLIKGWGRYNTKMKGAFHTQKKEKNYGDSLGYQKFVTRIQRKGLWFLCVLCASIVSEEDDDDDGTKGDDDMKQHLFPLFRRQQPPLFLCGSGGDGFLKRRGGGGERGGVFGKRKMMMMKCVLSHGDETSLDDMATLPGKSSRRGRGGRGRGRRALVILPPLLLVGRKGDVANARDEDDHHQEEGARAENDEITSFAYFTVGRCESIVRAERALGGDAVCSEKDAEMFGTVRIGLYGNRCPGTVRAFRKVVESGAYERTVFHDVRKGEFVAFGINGSKRLGQVSVPDGIFDVGERNADFTNAASFTGNHLKPGTVSLALSYDGTRTASPFDGNVYTEILVTTGPAPVPSLDGKNIIFGQVDRESLDVISKIANTPVFSPSSQVKAWNFIANRVGDERAAKSKLIWTKPTQAVAIFDSGIIEV